MNGIVITGDRHSDQNIYYLAIRLGIPAIDGARRGGLIYQLASGTAYDLSDLLGGVVDAIDRIERNPAFRRYGAGSPALHGRGS